MSPDLELQGAVVAALKADAGVMAIARGVHDKVPAGAEMPYVSIGPSSETSEDADCVTGFAVAMQIDCWAREPGFVGVKRLADAVRRAVLADGALTLAVNALVLIEHRQTRTFRDADGTTSHSAMTFEAIVEQP